MNSIVVKWKRLRPQAIEPSKATAGSVGWDLYAAEVEARGQWLTVNLGFAIEIPEGWEMQIRPRSGLSSRGLILVPTTGTIDSDYRGELHVRLWRLDSLAPPIYPGDRVAQAVFATVPDVKWFQAKELSSTERGDGGFGSTGK